ncbi:ArsR/SmtB family transcription factor [Micromonospora profundi]|uniref:ArsR/SmtB family transcription factor n=1 Tax=Micromonospora TaxID=1873 RepID=UPI0006AEE7A4|nr:MULTISPECIES: metalloregulator ArsR/SmtB family transcription factor [Micromonospora]KOX09920.1 ArsR family transcriptional regulator [Micromonospora sp. NRRL B-16802]NJC12546.1 DNA-binding transcriptional ArsR family regulator [Micromonospora profundi]
MAKYAGEGGSVLDSVFQALADPTRRQVVERLTQGPATTSDLARPFDMALPSFTQHLHVLEQSGLVTSEKTGRVRTYRLAPQPLEHLDTWLAAQRARWTRRLDQLDSLLYDLKEQER